MGNHLTIEVNPKTREHTITRTPKDKYYDNSRARDDHQKFNDKEAKRLSKMIFYKIKIAAQKGHIYADINMHDYCKDEITRSGQIDRIVNIIESHGYEVDRYVLKKQDNRYSYHRVSWT